MAAKQPAVQYEKTAGGIAVLTINNPPVNGLGHPVRTGLVDGLARAHTERAIAVVIIGGGATFPAGADIREFATGGAMKSPNLNQVLDALEGSRLPIVAAIHGTAFGGGLETALTAHYRIAVPSAAVGLPEVGLGLLPGAGGTQRLPRVVGVQKAIELITTGRPVKAKEALKLGILDAIVAEGKESALLAEAIAYAGKIAAAPLAPRRVSTWPVPGPASRALFDQATAMVQRASKGFLAPVVIVDAISGVLLPTFAEGMAHEQACFLRLFSDLQSRAMQSMFFAERESSKIPGIDGLARPLRTAGVVGAGTMGAGIATCFINVGVPVVLVETSQALLDAGLARIRSNYASAVKRGKMTAADVDRRLSLVTPALAVSALASVDVVIEAVFERLDLKRTVMAGLDKVCKAGALLCTNTSTLDVDAIAAATTRPADVIGTHFFSPAHAMLLLENVRGAASSPSTIATAMALGKLLKKKAVLVGNCHGFVANRMIFPYSAEALALLEEGAEPAQVDGALVAFGMPMGPLAMADLAGLDIGASIRAERAKSDPAAAAREGSTASAIADGLSAAGRHGQKSGAGFYRYEASAPRVPIADPAVSAVLEAHSRRVGVTRRAIPDAEIVERCILAMINEGFRCLGEGMAQRPTDIDVIFAYGFGFPRYRGGPMFYAEQDLGLETLLERLRALAARMPKAKHFAPAPLLVELVRDDVTLKAWAAKKGAAAAGKKGAVIKSKL